MPWAPDGPSLTGSRAQLADRAQMLFDKIKAFPEAGTEAGFFRVRPDAWVAFLDLRQMMEREILPALAELERLQRRPADHSPHASGNSARPPRK